MFTPKGTEKHPISTVLCSMQPMDILRSSQSYLSTESLKDIRPAVANRNSDAPKTSDNSNITLYSALFVGAVIITSIVLKRRFRTNK